jgi:hypothetical protein
MSQSTKGHFKDCTESNSEIADSILPTTKEEDQDLKELEETVELREKVKDLLIKLRKHEKIRAEDYCELGIFLSDLNKEVSIFFLLD